jgi:hypothetical protein
MLIYKCSGARARVCVWLSANLIKCGRERDGGKSKRVLCVGIFGYPAVRKACEKEAESIGSWIGQRWVRKARHLYLALKINPVPAALHELGKFRR